MVVYLLRRRGLGRTSCSRIAEFSTTGIQVVRSDNQPLFEGRDTVIRWGCTANLARADNAFPTVLNESATVHWCNDKRASRMALQIADISVPRSWFYWGEFANTVDYADYTTRGRTYIARKNTHAQGRELVHGSPAFVVRALVNWGEGYIAEYIPKVKEYRVYIIQGRVACVAEKTVADPTQIAWNHARGGTFSNVRWNDWPIDSCIEALKAAALSGTDFSGVDVMVDAEGVPYILELNSAPSLTSEYRQRAFAKCFDYMVQNPEDPPQVELDEVESYRDIIHPAMVAH